MIRKIAFALLALEPTSVMAQAVTVPLPVAKPPEGPPTPSPSGTTTVPLPGSTATPAPSPAALTPLNPYGRPIDMTVGVQIGSRDLGEVPVHMDLAGIVTFDSAAFAAVVAPLLNPNGRAALDEMVRQHPQATSEDLKTAGITAFFDRENVVITIRSIFAKFRQPQPLYNAPDDTIEKAVTATPEPFSFFLNVGLSETKVWNGTNPGWRDPAVYLTSAMRAGGFVVEFQGQFADRTPSAINRDYRFDRNFVRVVYDLPSDYVRLIAGDLTPEVRFQQNFVQMGGFGISRQKRRFDDFRSAILQGNRQLILQNEATVDVYRNGVLFQQIQLAPGAYDLANLPLLSGSNDIRIDVHDASGVSQSLAYQTYIDPIDLDPGDYEAALYIGKLSTTLGLSPKYDGQWAVTGFYRKAFYNHPAIGFGIQASGQVKQFSAQTQFLVGNGGRLDTTGAVSHSPLGTGWLLGISYDLALSKGDRSDSVNLQAVWQSRYFTGLGAPFLVNSNELTATAVYSHAFSPQASMQIGATYSRNRAPFGDDYRIYVDADYRISRVWSLRGGIDYQHFGQSSFGFRRTGLGFNIALIFQPGYADRAEARYDYRIDSAQLSYQHAPDGYVGSVGFGALAQRTSDFTSLNGFASYRGNRFDAGISQSMTGTSIGSFTDRQVTNIRMSTAIVYAGGSLAVSRRVGDSFAILEPHASLGSHKVVLGQLLIDPRYRASSGTFGGAVDGSLGSYHTQSIYYDVEDAPPGYDIGPGTYRVRPPYHSGYRLIVGSEAYVTAIGTLVGPGDVPISTAGGLLIDLDVPDSAGVAMFTNSVGRFAAASLRPGHHYRIKLYSGALFEFTVPEKSEALLDLKRLSPDSGE